MERRRRIEYVATTWEVQCRIADGRYEAAPMSPRRISGTCRRIAPFLPKFNFGSKSMKRNLNTLLGPIAFAAFLGWLYGQHVATSHWAHAGQDASLKPAEVATLDISRVF